MFFRYTSAKTPLKKSYGGGFKAWKLLKWHKAVSTLFRGGVLLMKRKLIKTSAKTKSAACVAGINENFFCSRADKRETRFLMKGDMFFH